MTGAHPEDLVIYRRLLQAEMGPPFAFVFIQNRDPAVTGILPVNCPIREAVAAPAKVAEAVMDSGVNVPKSEPITPLLSA